MALAVDSRPVCPTVFGWDERLSRASKSFRNPLLSILNSAPALAQACSPQLAVIDSSSDRSYVSQHIG
jgi:hypothetical protein